MLFLRKQQGYYHRKVAVPKRVLIVDDGVFFRKTLREILTAGGYDVVGEAENGVQALAEAIRLRPDIIILDVVMPIKNGLEAAREISGLAISAKIVMCTSLGYEPIVDEAVSSGASGYILKPLNELKVLSALKNLYPAETC